MPPDRPTDLGILDWGIGGMGCYRAWKNARPDVPIIYWSDSGETAYGTLGPERLRARLEVVCRELTTLGVRRIAVACNAASTVAEQLDVDVPVDSVLEPGVRTTLDEIAELDAPTIGVLGGRRTIESRLYQNKLQGPGRTVDARIAQPLSGLVERGIVSGPEIDATLDAILDGLQGADAVVLACTHYPAVRSQIQEKLPDTTLIDPVDSLVDRLRARWPEPTRDPEGRDQFFTTGDPGDMAESAETAFGVSPDHIVPVQLDP